MSEPHLHGITGMRDQDPMITCDTRGHCEDEGDQFRAGKHMNAQEHHSGECSHGSCAEGSHLIITDYMWSCP